jgi:hypothetical protein
LQLQAVLHPLEEDSQLLQILATMSLRYWMLRVLELNFAAMSKVTVHKEVSASVVRVASYGLQR